MSILNLVIRSLYFVRTVLGLAAIAFLVGLFAPMMTITKFVLVEDTYSIATGIQALLNEGQIFLFLLILGFSVLFPMVKLGLLFQVAYSADEARTDPRYLHWIATYGKWSMLDVFVVAVLVVVLKLGWIAQVETHVGLYAFAVSVLLTMWATHLLQRAAAPQPVT